MATVGSGGLGMGIILSIRDNFSRNANKYNRSITGMNTTTNAATKGITSSLALMGSGLAAMGAGILILAPLAKAVQKSAILSDQLAEVTKTTGLTGEALQQLNIDIGEIDTRTSTKELLSMAKAGGAMGVAQKDIAGFVNSIDKLNVALGDQFESPEKLARDLVKLRNVLGDVRTDEIDKDLLNIGNALNFMGANSSALEGNIVNIVSRMAGLGQELGATSPQLFGLATAMDELGVRAEVAGSNVPLAMQKMAKDYDKFAAAIGVDAREFKKMVNRDIVGALTFFAERLKSQEPTATGMASALSKLGLSGARIAEVFLKIGSNTELINKRIKQSGEALKGTGSIMDEFNAKNTTLQAVLDKASKRFGQLGSKIGKALAPTVLILAAGFEKLFQFIAKVVSSPLGQWLIRAIALLGVLLTVGGAVVVMIGLWQLATATLIPVLWAALAPLLPFIAAALIVGAVAIFMFRAFDDGSPKVMALAAAIGILVFGALGVLIVGVLLAKRAINEFQDVMKGADPKEGFFGFLQKAGGVILGIIEIFKTWNGETFTLSRTMAESLEKLGILQLVLTIATWVVRIKEFLKGVGQGFIKLFGIIKNAFSRIGKAFVPLFTNLGKLFGAVGKILVHFGLMDNQMDKSVTSIETWLTAGKILIDFLFFGFKVALEVVIFALETIIGVISSVVGAFAWLFNSVTALFTGEKGLAEIGSEFVDGIMSGIKGAWSRLTGFWTNLIRALPFGENLLGFIGVESGEAGEAGGVSTAGTASEIGEAAATSKAKQAAAQQPTIIDKSTEIVKEIKITTTIDGDILHEKVLEMNEIDESRD